MAHTTKGLAYTKRTFRYSSNKGFIWPKEWMALPSLIEFEQRHGIDEEQVDRHNPRMV